LTDFQNNTQILNFTKKHPVGAELFHMDGRIDGHTDMTKPVATYCNFMKVPKTAHIYVSNIPTILCKMQLKCPC